MKQCALVIYQDVMANKDIEMQETINLGVERSVITFPSSYYKGRSAFCTNLKCINKHVLNTAHYEPKQHHKASFWEATKNDILHTLAENVKGVKINFCISTVLDYIF